MNSARTFVNYFNRSYSLPNRHIEDRTLQNEFLEEFVVFIPEIIAELQSCLNKKQAQSFYHKLGSLKFLCEYTDPINRYYYLLRAYSGGLKRLLENPNQQKAIEVYIYHYNKYGGRRVLKDENWFENLRWKFLDQLIEVEDDESLQIMIAKSFVEIDEFFQVYRSELLLFLNDVKRFM